MALREKEVAELPPTFIVKVKSKTGDYGTLTTDAQINYADATNGKMTIHVAASNDEGTYTTTIELTIVPDPENLIPKNCSASIEDAYKEGIPDGTKPFSQIAVITCDNDPSHFTMSGNENFDQKFALNRTCDVTEQGDQSCEVALVTDDYIYHAHAPSTVHLLVSAFNRHDLYTPGEVAVELTVLRGDQMCTSVTDCSPEDLGDEFCNEECNNEACDYDAGRCPTPPAAAPTGGLEKRHCPFCNPNPITPPWWFIPTKG